MANTNDVKKKAIVEHIKNIYSESELLESSTCRKFRQVRLEGDRTITKIIPHNDLDAIISVGYRVKSQRGVVFRRWARESLPWDAYMTANTSRAS